MAPVMDGKAVEAEMVVAAMVVVAVAMEAVAIAITAVTETALTDATRMEATGFMKARIARFIIHLSPRRDVSSGKISPNGIRHAARYGTGRTTVGCDEVSRARTVGSTIGNTAIFAVIMDIIRNFAVKLMQRTECPFALVSQQRSLLQSTSMP